MSPAKTKSSKGKPPATAASAGKSVSDVDLVRELAAIVETHALSELVYDTESLTLTLRRGIAAAAMPGHSIAHAPAMAPIGMPHMPAMGSAPTHMPAAAEQAGGKRDTTAEGNGAYHMVTSPFVGTFYRSPNPDSPKYVEVGQRVEKGQVLCIVEAMKLMNEIEADAAGTVAACMVENAEPVEYGQALFKIAPS
jgi:acetyl-CoA carboxylase biotin carboxyl carrier protein